MKWFAANFRLASTCTCICHVWCWGFESGALSYLYNSVQGDDVARVLQSDRLVRSQTTVASLCCLPKEVHVQHKARARIPCVSAWRGHQWVPHPPAKHPLHASWYSASLWFRPVFSPEISFKGVHNEIHSRDCHNSIATKQYVNSGNVLF